MKINVCCLFLSCLVYIMYFLHTHVARPPEAHVNLIILLHLRQVLYPPPPPANTGHSLNAVSMLAQRRRRWANIETAFSECLVFAVSPRDPRGCIHVLLGGSCGTSISGRCYKSSRHVKDTVAPNSLTLTTLKYFLYKPWRPKVSFNLKSS